MHLVCAQAAFIQLSKVMLPPRDACRCGGYKPYSFQKIPLPSKLYSIQGSDHLNNSLRPDSPIASCSHVSRNSHLESVGASNLRSSRQLGLRRWLHQPPSKPRIQSAELPGKVCLVCPICGCVHVPQQHYWSCENQFHVVCGNSPRTSGCNDHLWRTWIEHWGSIPHPIALISSTSLDCFPTLQRMQPIRLYSISWACQQTIPSLVSRWRVTKSLPLLFFRICILGE